MNDRAKENFKKAPQNMVDNPNTMLSNMMQIKKGFTLMCYTREISTINQPQMNHWSSSGAGLLGDIANAVLNRYISFAGLHFDCLQKAIKPVLVRYSPASHHNTRNFHGGRN